MPPIRTINLDDGALLDAVSHKTDQAIALLQQIADDYSPAVLANSLGAEALMEEVA